MTARQWEDLNQFLDPAEFGDVLTVTTGAGAGRKIAGIFEEIAVDAETGDFSMATADDPTFHCKACDVRGLKKHDAGTIDGVEYELTSDPLPDGTGMAVLRLGRV